MQEFIKMCDHHADHFARLGPEEQQARVNKFIEDQRKFAEGLQRQFRVTVPVSLTLSDKVSAAVRGLAESLGGTLYATPAIGRIDYLSFRYVVPLAAIRKMSNENSPFAENGKPSYTLNPKDAWLDKHYLDQRLSGSFIGFSRHYETNSSFSQRLRRLALAVRLRFEDSGVLSCKVPYLVNRILPGVVVIFENLLHQRDQSVFVASFQDFGLGYDAYNDGDTRKAVSTTDFVALLPTPIHFEVSLIIPEEKTKRITGVEAKYEEVDSLENLKTEDVCLTRFRPS
ncbi:MAG TPA: hypothetical protein VGQ08_16810 [Nitrospiraceae bacterium]|jgi:hypothetical protein|nr:hypothetical protein [Nitrospiraceae bacterium]